MIFYYDLARCPPTFDGVTAAMAFEHRRRQLGDRSMRIEVLPGPVGGFRRDPHWPQSISTRILLRDHVLLPILRMLPSAYVTLRASHPSRPEPGSFGFGQYVMNFGEFVKAYAAGVRPLRPTQGQDEALPDLVTITLREAEHWPERNSRLPEWLAAAGELVRNGWRVIIVRDTHRAGQALPGAYGINVNMSASMSLEARARLYRSAFCNMFVNNGPAWFCMALDAPCVIVRPATEGIGRTYAASWFRRFGIDSGEQFPAAPRYQRLQWQDDKADAILQAFADFHALNGSAEQCESASSRTSTIDRHQIS